MITEQFKNNTIQRIFSSKARQIKFHYSNAEQREYICKKLPLGGFTIIWVLNYSKTIYGIYYKSMR